MSKRRYEDLPDWVGMFASHEPDNSPEAIEARRVAGGFREMTPAEVAEVASAEVRRRLAAFDAVWEFVVSHDTSAWENGWGYLAESTEGEWYETGARETLDQIRKLMTKEDTC